MQFNSGPQGNQPNTLNYGHPVSNQQGMNYGPQPPPYAESQGVAYAVAAPTAPTQSATKLQGVPQTQPIAAQPNAASLQQGGTSVPPTATTLQPGAVYTQQGGTTVPPTATTLQPGALYAQQGGGAVVVQAQQVTQGAAQEPLKFKDGMCDCCNQCVPSCCTGYWCFCILLGQVREKIGLNKCWQTVFCLSILLIIGLALLDVKDLEILGFIILLVYWCTSCIFTYHARETFIKKNAITEGQALDPCTNACCSCCCACCMVTQLARSLHNYQGIVDECACNTNGDVSMDVPHAL